MTETVTPAATKSLPPSLRCATCGESTTFTTSVDLKTYCNRMHLITYDAVLKPHQIIQTCTSWIPVQRVA